MRHLRCGPLLPGGREPSRPGGWVAARYDSAVPSELESALRAAPLFRRLRDSDRDHLAAICQLRVFEENQTLFEEGQDAQWFLFVSQGRVKIFKSTASGKDLILEILGPGEPVGAVAVYEERVYPATATALERTVCVMAPRGPFLRLLEQHPSLVRGLLSGLTLRLIELTNRLAELTGGRLEPRFARTFLKMADEHGQPTAGGIFIPVRLSRQELADLCGTTVETCIRIMSRWGKEGVVRTERDGFVLVDRRALARLAES